MNPDIHAKNSVKKYGGVSCDYLPIHQWMDQCRAHIPTLVHRIILHNSWGIALGEQQFGEFVKVGSPEAPRWVRQNFIINSDGNKVYLKDILQDHVLEDMGGVIPSLSQTFSKITVELVANQIGAFAPLLRRIRRELDKEKKEE